MDRNSSSRINLDFFTVQLSRINHEWCNLHNLSTFIEFVIVIEALSSHVTDKTKEYLMNLNFWIFMISTARKTNKNIIRKLKFNVLFVFQLLLRFETLIKSD